jgi:glyoxylase-like metal-dependent hydrolase (beta-lactamase superfamily II)
VDEILPGLWHWTTTHAKWGIEISTYWLAAERVVIDPRVPEEGIGWFDASGGPVAALLTNRHHYRDAGLLAERFGARVLCSRLGAQEFTHGEPVEFFTPGDELPGGVTSFEVGGICPDETALLCRAHRALAVADGLVRFPPDGPLGFVPDEMMYDPPRTRARLVEAYARLLQEDWDALLPAHGLPIAEGAKEAVRAFVAAHGGGAATASS